MKPEDAGSAGQGHDASAADGGGATTQNQDAGGDAAATNPSDAGTKPADAGSCDDHCSADERSVLDCKNKLVKKCAASQGCGSKATCEDACALAAERGSSVGCDFYSALPAPEYDTRGSCFAAYVVNTWSSAVTLSADYAGTQLDLSSAARKFTGNGSMLSATNGTLAPGETAVIYLAQYPSGDSFVVSCPTSAAIGTNIVVDKNGFGSAFHLKSSAPVAAYDVYPFGSAASIPSATLLLPTNTWGKAYLAADGFASDVNLSGINGLPFLQVVAAQDATTVTIYPTAAIESGTNVNASAAAQNATFMLNKGQMLQLEQNDELAGSSIKADKPIGVWGGSSCMNVPVGNTACDSAHQQLPPLSALGHEYVGVGYRDRVPAAGEQIWYTLVGAVDNTVLQYDPSPIAGAPSTLQGRSSATFSSATAFVVTSQDAAHPFYFAAHMTGFSSVNGNSNNAGDPDYVNVVSTDQQLSKYVFVTDPNYPTTNLVFTRKKSAGAFQAVKLDCGGTLSGWTNIGTGGNYQYTRVDLISDGVVQASCDNGEHTASSAAPFGLTVWGWDAATSYAYVAGMSLQALNSVSVPTP